MVYSAAVSIPSFVGSSLSLIASLTILILHVLNPPQWHIRHALIVNLLIADLINATTNTIGGVDTFIHRRRQPTPILAGRGCTASGFFGQFSAQAIDSNVLVISVVVLFVVLQNNVVAAPSETKVILICLFTWLPSTITSFVGLGLHLYAPVSGNWCWIEHRYLGFRYALTYAWRIFIFFATTGIYVFIYIHLKRKYGTILDLMAKAHTASEELPEMSTVDHIESTDTSHILVLSTCTVSEVTDTPAAVENVPSHGRVPSPHSGMTADIRLHDLSADAKGRLNSAWRLNTPQVSSTDSPQSRWASHNSQCYSGSVQRHLNLRRMLLLRGYPALYILLWTPDMVNRLVESIGTAPIWLQALQATGQFMGLANALTYGLNERRKSRSARIRDAEHRRRPG